MFKSDTKNKNNPKGQRMKTKSAILFLILFIPSIFFAGEVPIEQAKSIAQKVYFEKQSRTSELAVESIVVTDDLTITGERGPLMCRCFRLSISRVNISLSMSRMTAALPLLIR